MASPRTELPIFHHTGDPSERYFKIIQYPDQLDEYNTIDPDGTLVVVEDSSQNIARDGGVIIDPKEDQYGQVGYPYVGLYYCGPDSIMYYFQYGSYYVEVYPEKGQPYKKSKDEGAACFFSPRLRIGPLQKITPAFLWEWYRKGVQVTYRTSYPSTRIDTPIVDYVIKHIDWYGNRPGFEPLADSLLSQSYQTSPLNTLEVIFSWMNAIDTSKVIRMLSAVMSHKTDIGAGVFDIVQMMKYYYDNFENSNDPNAMIPVIWMLFWLRKQYPSVFAITVGQFPKLDQIEAQWKETGYRTPDGFMRMMPKR